jgi:hypothetical protein
LTEWRAGTPRQLLDRKVSGTRVYDLATHFEIMPGQIRVDYLNASWLIRRRLQPGRLAHGCLLV